jgi:hypothetical protein
VEPAMLLTNSKNCVAWTIECGMGDSLKRKTQFSEPADVLGDAIQATLSRCAAKAKVEQTPKRKTFLVLSHRWRSRSWLDARNKVQTFNLSAERFRTLRSNLFFFTSGVD